MAQSLLLYDRLTAEVDQFLDGVYRRIGAGMVCGPGCDACCRNSLTLLPVEAFRLREGFDGLAASEKQKVTNACQALASEGRQGPCPVLHDGRCLLYEHRPLVCRTHGFPLYSTEFAERGGTPVDFCPLNFTEGSKVETIPGESILNIDILNRKLFLVNKQFIDDMGWRHLVPDARIDMKELFTNDSLWRLQHHDQ